MKIYTLIEVLLLVLIVLCQIIPSWRSRLYVNETGGTLKTPYFIILVAAVLISMQFSSQEKVKNYLSKRSTTTVFTANIQQHEHIGGTWSYTIKDKEDFVSILPFLNQQTYTSLPEHEPMHHKIEIKYKSKSEENGKIAYTFEWHEWLNDIHVIDFNLYLQENKCLLIRHNYTFAPFLKSQNTLLFRDREYIKMR